MATVKTAYRRASEFVEGIGESLETIQGRDVILRSYEVDNERPMRGENATLVTMKISEPESEDEIKLFHAWSKSLAQRLEEIPASAFPVLVAFKRVNTSSGFRVWTFE